MIRVKRVIALILAVALLASGLPMSLAAADEIPIAEEPAIRFQHTGFDEDTSILTMTLQVKGTAGKYLKEGMFAFQVNTNVLIPMTNPVEGEAVSMIPGQSGKVGYVMSRTGARPNDVQLFAQQNGVDMSGGVDFNTAMNAHHHDNSTEGHLGAGDFNSSYTGYFVSGERAVTLQNDLVDCYLQYMFSTPPSLNEEYIDVIDLNFLCIRGYDFDGPIKAGDTNSLLSGAIVLPADETEAQEILEPFDYLDGSGERKLLALGAAGFREAEGTLPVAQEVRTVNYYGDPQPTDWRTLKWDGSTVSQESISGVPGLTYPNMDLKYLVKSFYAGTDNTYTYKGDTAGSGNDFYIPDSESKNVEIPRYAVPEAVENKANDEAGLTDPTAWIPRAYTGRSGVQEKKVPLKYELGTRLLDSSLTSPEAELGIVEFMNRVSWELAIDEAGTLLSSVTYNLEGTSWTENGKTIQYATINDERYPEYSGYRLQITTEQDGSEVVSPVGVTFDLLDSQVTWSDPSDGDQERTDIAPAPQFHVTSTAADNKSYLWQKKNNETGRLFLVGTYHDESSRNEFTQTLPIEVKLYKEDSVPTSMDLSFDEVGTVNDGEKDVIGFQVGKGRNGVPDVDVGASGVTVKSNVYDQYGLPMADKVPTLTVAPDSETEAGMKEKKKKNAFTVVATDQPGRFLVKYGVDAEDGNDPFTVNDVFDGNYIVSASFQEGKTKLEANSPEADRTLRILKEPDELAVLRLTDFGTQMETDPSEPDVEIRAVRIPIASEKDVTLKMVPYELSNQWRDIDDITQENKVAEYDIVPDLRDSNGMMSLDLINQSGALTVEYEFSIAPGSSTTNHKGLDTSGASYGEIGVSYQVPDNTRLLYTIKVWYKKDKEKNPPDQVKTYKIILQRDPVRLQRIEMLKVNSNTNFIKVPDYYDDGGTPTTVYISANPYTQYNDQTTWDTLEILYRKNTIQNPSEEDFVGKINIKGGVDSLPSGVTFDEDTWDLTVAAGAPSCDVVVYASFGNSQTETTSSEMTIRIRRDESVPKELFIEYPNGNKVIPSNKAQNTSKVIAPKIEATDQYQADMTSGYRIEWSITSADYPDEISIDKETGKITVAPCAHNGYASLRLLVYDKDNNYCFRKTYNNLITIDRGAINTTNVEVTTKVIEYREETTLELKVSTQYGDSGEVNSAVWELLSVTPSVGDAFTVENGGISTSSSGTSGGTVSLTKSGRLSFSQVLDMNPDNAPQKVKVKLTVNSSLSCEQEIEIHRDPIQIPTDIYIPTEVYAKQISVPDENELPSKRTLVATVRDQYGLKVANSAVSWSWDWENKPDDVDFVEGSIDIKNGNELTVTNLAPSAVITVTATQNNGTKFRTEAILISAEDADPSRVEIAPVISDVIGTDNAVPLPAKSSAGDTYQLTAKVMDQRGLRMPGKTVTWSVESGSASIESATGKLTVKFDQGICDSGTKKGNVVVKATTLNNLNNPVEKTMTIEVIKQEAIAAYAVPKLDLTDPDTIFANGNLVQIPAKGDPDNKATVKATVYSQYQEEMPGEKAEFSQPVTVRGLTFLDNQDGTATLTLSSVIPERYTEIVAKPLGMQGTAQDMDKNNGKLCTVRVDFERAPGYAYELAKGQWNTTSNKIEPDDSYAPVPNWVSQADSFVPSGPSRPQEYTFGAQILDQYGTDYRIDNNVSVKWVFEKDYPDVEFVGANADGSFTGKTATIRVGNQAVERTKTEEIVRINLTAVGVEIDQNDPEEVARFQDTLEVHLQKNASKETYLYVDGSTELGIAEEVLARPYQEESTKYPDKPFKSNSRTISATVYDQYGFAVPEAERTVSLVEESVTDQGMTVETQYKAGESAENGNIPEHYTIKNEKKETIAEYNSETGLLTLNYTSTLTEIRFLAESKSLGMTKEFTLPIEIEESEETSVKVVRETPKTYTIRSTSADNMAEHVHAEVYDQYGVKMPSPTEVNTTWQLQMLDKEGKLVQYVDYGDDGLPKLPSQYLMQLQAGSLKDANITVLPAEFKSDQTIYLTCELYNLSGSPLYPPIINTVPIYVKKYRESELPPSYYIVGYEPGEHGVLVGNSLETVFGGSGVAAVPEIDSDAGYAFKGWSVDGENIVNLSTWIVSDNVTFTALYNHVEEGKFLNGYSDGTIQPDRKITRAEFVTLLANVVGGYDPATDYGISFRDVTVDKWYANIVAFAKIKGFVNGYEDGTFHPNENISRAEAATMIASAMKLTPKHPSTPTYSDVPATEWFYGYVETLAYEKIISGYGDGTFHPNADIKRAEAVTMLVPISRYPLTESEAELIKKYGESPFKDLDINWAYAYILRAAGVA